MSAENKKITIDGERKLRLKEIANIISNMPEDELRVVAASIPFDICIERISTEYHKNRDCVDALEACLGRR